jgi:hypothetical protein
MAYLLIVKRAKITHAFQIRSVSQIVPEHTLKLSPLDLTFADIFD